MLLPLALLVACGDFQARLDAIRAEQATGSAGQRVPLRDRGEDTHERDGFTPIAEHDLACVPGTRRCFGLAGEWSLIRGLDNLSVLNTLTSALLDEPVVQIRFPAGMSDGGEPIRFDGWGPTIDREQANQYREIYVSFWLKIRGIDYQNQTVGTKILYVSYGSSQRQNHSFFMLQGNGTQSTMTAMPLSFYMSEMRDDGSDSGGGAVSHGANVNDVRFTVGEWHHVELWLKINDINPTVANGEVKWWLDGTLLAHHTGKRFRSDLNPKGLYHLQVTPVYGGNSGDVRTRDDYWLMDDLYISAIEHQQIKASGP